MASANKASFKGRGPFRYRRLSLRPAKLPRLPIPPVARPSQKARVQALRWDGLDLLVQANGRNGGRLRYVKPDGREGLAALISYPVIRLFHWEETGALDSAAALIAFGFAATSLLT